MHLIVISVLLLGLALLCYPLHPTIFLILGIVYSFFTAYVVGFSAAWLLLIYPVTFVIWGIFRTKQWRWWKFSATLVAATAMVWGIALIEFLPQWREIQDLARDYPVQRIDKRLSYERPRPHISTNHESETVDEETLRLATQIYEISGGWRWYDDFRGQSLAALEETHNDFVAAFAAQQGFGLGRLQRWPARDGIIRLPPAKTFTLGPPPRLSVSATAEGRIKRQSPDSIKEDAYDWHASSVANFSNADGFGHITDRNTPTTNTADESVGARTITARGFESHAFQSIPKHSPWGGQWRLTRLDLVSLLKHDSPAVYLSESLPRMDELSSEDVPTRPLDEFESSALKRLRIGEVIVVRRGRNRVRMLGALLATQECVRCHSVEQGQMLGAFSYEFLRKEPLPAQEPPRDAAPPLT